MFATQKGVVYNIKMIILNLNPGHQIDWVTHDPRIMGPSRVLWM
jgi:hypothetical protein